MGKSYFTEEEIEIAKNTSLTALAESLGFTPKKAGRNYILKEMDSLVIYNDRTWHRWSGRGRRTGNSQIDFLLEFGDCESIVEAVQKLLVFQGYTGYGKNNATVNKNGSEIKGKKEFLLPEKTGQYKCTYKYLMETRSLSVSVINYFVKDLRILYEDIRHNIVFLGLDKGGVVRYAAIRGTADIYGYKFKGDVPGNDKNFGVNIINLEDNELKVFESTIDCMSYIDITGDYTSNKLVLSMIQDNPLVKFIEEYKHIKRIGFYLDNDLPAKNVIYGEEETIDILGKVIKEKKIGLIEKYSNLGFLTEAKLAPNYPGCKDYNECLKYMKENMPQHVYALSTKKS